MEEIQKTKAKMLTVQEAANLVDGLKPFRIRQLCKTGELPCIMAGNKTLINEKVFLQFIGEPIN